MESVWKNKLTKAKKNSQFLKILFQYPSSDRVVVKRGYVSAVFDDGFEFEEKFDGLVAYAFEYIVEIKEEVRE